MSIQPLTFILFCLSMVITTVVGFVGAVFYLNIRSRSFRKKHAIPEILGKWKCQWFDDASDSTGPKVEDTVEIIKWLRDSEFEAVGHQPQYHLSYPITGEVDPSRFITMEYRAAKYPYEQNRGVVCLVLSRDGKHMEGHWYGRRSSGILGGGKVLCSRMQ